MREGLLKALKPTRKLRQLLVLFALVLMPGMAWAQTDFNLTIAGIDVTSENADAISGTGITGTVKYTYENNSSMLTLENATIDGQIVWGNASDLTIEISGKCSIVKDYGNTMPDAVIKATAANASYNLTIKNKDEESATLKFAAYGKDGGNVVSASSSGFTIKSSLNYSAISEEEIEYAFYSTENITTYNYLKVGDINVHNIPGEIGCYNDILNDGSSVSFNPDDNILTFNNATITDKRIFWGAEMNTALTINLIGANTITNTTESCIVAESNSLTFTRGDNANPCSLELSSPEGSDVISGFSGYTSPTGLYWLPTSDASGAVYSATVTSSPLGGGEGTEAAPFLINDYDNLKTFSTLVNNNVLTTEYVKLNADIDCTGKTDFAPIGNGTEPFQGNLDGNGKTIGNLSMTDVDDEKVGLFGYNSGTIKNLTLSGCTISGGNGSDNFIGVLVGQNNGTIDGCTVINSIVSCKENSQNPRVGGIAGSNETGTVSGCEVKGTTTITADYSNSSTSVYAGAIMGENSGGTTKGNTYESTITTKTKKQGDTDYTTKSGQTQRGIGNGEDAIGQVELAGTKKVTITDTSTHGDYEVGADSYLFDKNNNILYALPNSTVTINASPDNGYRPSLNLSDNTIEVTAVEKTVGETYDHTEFTFTMSSDDVTATLTFGISLSATGVAATIDNATYTGSAIEPTTVKVTGVPGATSVTALTKGTDFTIKGYKLNDEAVTSPTNAGTYTVTIEGTGNYTGTKDVDYTISQATNTITTIPVGATSLTYTGEAQALIATEGAATFGDVVYSLTADGTYGAAADIKGTNATTTDAPYTIYYKVVGTANYAGIDPASIQVSIAKASIKPEVNITGWTYGDYDDTKNAPNVTETTNPETGEVSYQYKVKDSGDDTYVAWPTITATLNAMAAGTYTIKATVAATSNYQAGSATKDFTISAKSITGATITLSAESFTFNGETQKPEVSVKDGETPLTLDTDYTLTNTGGTNVGEYTVTVTGKGNYDNTTTATKKFSITALETTPAVTLTNPDEVITYDGTGKEPNLTVTVTLTAGITELMLNTDYTVAYSDNTNVGEATATVTLKGNYSGTNATTFNIMEKSLTDNTITVEDIENQTYNEGNEVKPTVVVKDGSTILTVDKDYSVSYSNNTEIAKATDDPAPTVTITGKGNYKDFINKKFTITKASATITAPDQTVTYNAKAQEYTSATVSKGDITISYYSKAEDRTNGTNALAGAPTNAGTYYVQANQADEHYQSESANATFTIEQAEVTSVTLNQTELVYNPGVEQTVTVSKVMAGTLEVSADYYTVSGNSATTAGTYTVTVTAKTDIANNFKGSATATFTIKDRTAEISFGSGLTYQTYYNAEEDFLIPDGVSAYIITGVDGTTVTVKKVSNLKAGIPFLLENTAGSTITKDPNETFEGNLLKYAGDNVATSGKEYVLYKNEFVKATGNISTGKCYLDLGTVNPSRGMYGIGHDDSTAIEGIEPDGTENNEWFDLQGRRIQKPTKAGLYIVNGKKIVINNK